MPVQYDASSLLKCTVSLTYLRYVVIQTPDFAATSANPEPKHIPSQQAELEYALAQDAIVKAQNNSAYNGPGSFAYDENGNVTGVNP